MSKSEKVTISEEASNPIALYGSSCWHQQVDEKRADRAELEAFIATLEAENAELRAKAYRYEEALWSCRVVAEQMPGFLSSVIQTYCEVLDELPPAGKEGES